VAGDRAWGERLKRRACLIHKGRWRRSKTEKALAKKRIGSQKTRPGQKKRGGTVFEKKKEDKNTFGTGRLYQDIITRNQ